VKSAIQVAYPPAKPLVIYDGDCTFCRFWVLRWQHTTGEWVDYRPFQDSEVDAQFEELATERLQTALHFIETDGSVFHGAEAAFRALAYSPQKRWLLAWYEHSLAFAGASEWVYRFIAGHRPLFSKLTGLGWGQYTSPPSPRLVRWLFLRSLGAIYLIAFVSLWIQISGLTGANGILPAGDTMEIIRRQATAHHVGLDRYHLVPTLCWFDTSDRFLKLQCAAGTGLAVFLIIGFAPVPCLFLLWLIYLSLTTVSQEFLSFQWDNLLLETGFLAIFFAPWQLLPRLARAPPPSRLVLWLFRWLLFRLMFESGCVKLLSGDPNWRNLTALTVHYETQPLPTWVAWYVHQLPGSVQKASTLLMFFVELLVPFLIFAPRRLRHFACLLLIALQLLIFLTGNYCFFNLLTIALCLLLLDDAALLKLPPARWRAFLSTPRLATAPRRRLNAQLSTSGFHRWPRQLTVPLFCVTLAVSLLQFSFMFRLRLPWPAQITAVYQWLAPFRSLNNYGLFAVMTTTRPEIIIQGSEDGETWRDFEFKYKPGDVDRLPAFVEPHQPRLDWQMWFAALGNLQQNPWLLNFCGRLLLGSSEVLGLLGRNPFPNAPPRFIRAVVYEYHFTDFATRRRTGAWWRREFKGIYLPPISRRELPLG
jgi:predicted DCC family thiol-disulfide oxidoreductase YuxK